MLKDLLRYFKRKHVGKNEASPKAFFSSLCKGMLDPKENGRALAPVHFYKAEAPVPTVGLDF